MIFFFHFKAMWDLCVSYQKSGCTENKFGENVTFSTNFLLYNEIMLAWFFCFSKEKKTSKKSREHCAPWYLAKNFCPDESIKVSAPSLPGSSSNCEALGHLFSWESETLQLMSDYTTWHYIQYWMKAVGNLWLITAYCEGEKNPNLV